MHLYIVFSMSGPINENLLLLQQYTTQHPSNQQPGQQAVNHTTGQMNYLLSHAVTQPTFPGGIYKRKAYF